MERISTSYLEFMTDSFSIWQHSNGTEIDSQHGYALDDGARALIFVLNYGPQSLAPVYKNFIDLSVNQKVVVNFFGEDKQPLDKAWSEDAFGQAYWALSLWNQHYADSRVNLDAMEQIISKFESIRGMAYALIGANLSNSMIAKFLYERLMLSFQLQSSDNWPWVEPKLTYGNAIIPLGFLDYSNHFHENKALEIGLLMLDFLNTETKVRGVPITIGNNGWYSKNSKKAIFDQQPVDIAYQVIANITAYEITNRQEYLDEGKTYFSWFWGNNINSKVMIDVQNQRCLDGLHTDSASDNCGAESIICYLWAQEKIWPHLSTKTEVFGNRT